MRLRRSATRNRGGAVLRVPRGRVARRSVGSVFCDEFFDVGSVAGVPEGQRIRSDEKPWGRVG